MAFRRHCLRLFRVLVVPAPVSSTFFLFLSSLPSLRLPFLSSFRLVPSRSTSQRHFLSSPSLTRLSISSSISIWFWFHSYWALPCLCVSLSSSHSPFPYLRLCLVHFLVPSLLQCGSSVNGPYVTSTSSPSSLSLFLSLYPLSVPSLPYSLFQVPLLHP